jgi:ribonuclease P protein component
MASGAAGSAKARPIILKRRQDFLRVRKGARSASAAFVVEARPREGSDAHQGAGQARFGFTVTKQVGTAVERNRIRRRLKEAVRRAHEKHARSDFDYVVIARRPALEMPFERLCAELLAALKGVNRRVPPAPGAGRAKKNAR